MRVSLLTFETVRPKVGAHASIEPKLTWKRFLRSASPFGPVAQSPARKGYAVRGIAVMPATISEALAPLLTDIHRMGEHVRPLIELGDQPDSGHDVSDVLTSVEKLLVAMQEFLADLEETAPARDRRREAF